MTSLHHQKIFGSCIIAGFIAAFSFQAAQAGSYLDKPAKERLGYEEVVIPILEEKCFACHGKGKTKGDLSLESIESMKLGGDTGDPALVPGDLEKSMLISTLHLPLDDDLHMPPAKKTQLTKEEIDVLTWWVKSGAHTGKTLAQSSAPQNILTAVNHFIPEEIRQKRKIERLQKIAEQKANAKKEREALAKKWQSSLPKELMSLLRFVSPYDTSIHFSSVSLQQEFGDPEFAALAEARPHFTSIDISHSAITGRTIEMLPTSPKLTSLRLADTKLKSADLAPLTKLKHLETLSLHSTQIDKSALPTLAKIKSLRRLYLWNTKLNSKEIAQFAKQHPHLQINF